MAKQDRNFDAIADKFQQNIYATSKGKIRLAVLQRDLAECAAFDGQTPVLDIGAGQGQLAFWLAQRGHPVHLCDVSQDMLDIAQQNAPEGIAAKLRFSNLGLAELAAQGGQHPLIVCHAVLEWLAQPEEAIAQLYALLAPGGTLSLMFYNIDGKRLSNIIYGNFNYVLRDLTYRKKVSLSPQQPLDPNAVLDWCRKTGFVLQQKTGVRCFHDYLRDRSEQESAYAQLLETELRFNRQEPYASIGRYMHVLLQKPNA